MYRILWNEQKYNILTGCHWFYWENSIFFEIISCLAAYPQFTRSISRGIKDIRIRKTRYQIIPKELTKRCIDTNERCSFAALLRTSTHERCSFTWFVRTSTNECCSLHRSFVLVRMSAAVLHGSFVLVRRSFEFWLLQFCSKLSLAYLRSCKIAGASRLHI